MTTEKAQVRQSIPTARIIVDERIIEMNAGETRALKATAVPMLASNMAMLAPSDAQNAALLSALVTDKIEWNSSDTEIASVDESGIVTALKQGTCKIIAKSGECQIVFSILVNVAIPEWASEEFLEYVERIGAYTELPLGTDGSAGPTAQYVTFGWERQDGEIYHYTEGCGGVDERTQTSYKGYNYAKGEDDEWYYSWLENCYDESHDHSDLFLKSEIRTRYKYEFDEEGDFKRDEDGNIIRIPYEYEYTYPPKVAYRIHPRKWRLLDKEKGLMVMENYDYDMKNLYYSEKFSIFNYYVFDTDKYKNDINGMPAICNYGDSYLRAWLDGGEYLEYVPFATSNKDGNWQKNKNGQYILYTETVVQKFRMNERCILTHDGRTWDWGVKTNTDNPFKNFFAPGQLAQIKEVNLDCGEGGSAKGRIFILSEDEIRKYYSDGSRLCPEVKAWDGKTFWTRTRKKIDGKNTLCAVEINSDGTVKEFVRLEGYDTGKYNFFIPAICVKPQE